MSLKELKEKRLMKKHYLRKHGPGAYYGQKKKKG